MINDERLIEFWKNLTLSLQAELIQRGDEIDQYKAQLAAAQHALDFAVEQNEEMAAEIDDMRQENNMLFNRAAHRLAQLKEALARIAELEATP